MILKSKTFLKALTFLSFFYVGWVFPGGSEAVNPEAYYTFLVYFFSIVYIINQPHRIYLVSPALLVHFMLVTLMALSITWSINIFFSLKQLLAVSFVLLIHAIAVSHNPLYYFGYIRWLFYCIASLIAITLISVVLAYINSDLILNIADDQELTDTQNYFFIPFDLVSVLLIFGFAAFLLHYHKLIFKRYFFSIIILSLTILFANFSKTYLVATAAAIFAGWYLVNYKFYKRMLIIIGGIAMLTLVVFTENMFSQQLFWKSADFYGEVQSGNYNILEMINSSGRIQLSNYLENVLSQLDRETWGLGIGGTQYILRDNPSGAIWFSPHSDYVRVRTDFGYMGLFSYSCFLLFSLYYYSKKFRNAGDLLSRYIAIVIVMLFVYIIIGGIGYEFLTRVRTTLFVLVIFIGFLWRYEKNMNENIVSRQDNEK